MKRFYIALVVVCGWWMLVSGCKKKEIDPQFTEESPVFFCNGNINALPYNFQAGVDSYYMFSSYSFDSIKRLYSFIGDFKQVNCQNCKGVSIKLNDNQIFYVTGTSNIDSLFPGNYIYWTDSTGMDKINSFVFKSQPTVNDTVSSYTWDFGDGTTSKLEEPTHIYAAPGNYTVCHTIIYKNGCQDQICIPADNTANNLCTADFTYTPSATRDTIFFEATNDADTYSWNFGDGQTGSGKSAMCRYGKLGVYTVILTTTDSTGCQAERRIRIKTPKALVGCVSNFTQARYTSTKPSKKSIITVNWRDDKGVVYSTSNVAQPADAYFQILSIDEYLTNENNQHTKKIHARFKCYLSDGNKTITLSDADAIFAVAYP